MRRTSAIICEFNPFHNGHLHLIHQARESGSDRIVCIMSGNFVQRGEPAIVHKYARAKAAILSGADLVLELPMPFSASSAEYFARAGVYIAEGIGKTDELLFGSECGDINALSDIAENQLSEAFFRRFCQIYNGEKGYALSAQLAYEELFGKNAMLDSPNNILGIEYIKALKLLDSNIIPRTIAREDNFSSSELGNGFPSATALRKLIFAGETKKTVPQMPESVFEILKDAKNDCLFPMDMEKYGFALLSFLRLSSPEAILGCQGISGGLENRIIRAALLSSSYGQLLSELSTKKYTDARIRRTLLCSVLGIKSSDMDICIPYVNLLGASINGRELLSDIRKSSKIRIVTKISEKKSLFGDLEGKQREDAERLFALEGKADALYALCLPEARDAFFFGKMSPFLEKC